MGLLPYLLRERLMTVYNMPYLLHTCKISANEILKTQTLRKIVSEFTESRESIWAIRVHPSPSIWAIPSILYTKFGCHSPFNFVYKMYTEVCRNVGHILYILLYISCTSVVYILHNFCKQNVYMISVWGRHSKMTEID